MPTLNLTNGCFSFFVSLAGDFAKALSQLESVQTQLVSNLQENKAVLDGVKTSFAANIDTIKGNIATLERRIAALAPKK